jgi:hypothetical protein
VERKDKLRKIHSERWKGKSVGQQSNTTQAAESLMKLTTSGERKDVLGQGSSKTRVSKDLVVGTTDERGRRKKRDNRLHFDMRIVQATKYLLGEQTVVEVGKVLHHPECGTLRKGNGTSLRGLTPQGMEKGRVRILGGKGGGQPLTVMTVLPERLHALLEKAKGGGHNLYPRCK